MPLEESALPLIPIENPNEKYPLINKSLENPYNRISSTDTIKYGKSIYNNKLDYKLLDYNKMSSLTYSGFKKSYKTSA